MQRKQRTERKNANRRGYAEVGEQRVAGRIDDLLKLVGRYGSLGAQRSGRYLYVAISRRAQRKGDECFRDGFGANVSGETLLMTLSTGPLFHTLRAQPLVRQTML